MNDYTILSNLIKKKETNNINKVTCIRKWTIDGSTDVIFTISPMPKL